MIKWSNRWSDNFSRMKNMADEFVERDRQKHEAIRMEKELELVNMSKEERKIVEAVDAGINYHIVELGYNFRTNEEAQVKEICEYELCKEQNIKRRRPSYRMDCSTKDSIGIIIGFASEKLRDIEVESWNVNYIIRDLYNYNPRNKSQTAIERIRIVPDPRAVNPLLKALKNSNKHRGLILDALTSYLSSLSDDTLEIDNAEEVIQWAAKYSLINLCLHPYSENPKIIPFKHISELIEAVPEFASFVAKVGIQMSSSDPTLRIVAVKHIGADPEFLELLKRISHEDPDQNVREAAKTSLRRNHNFTVGSLTISSSEYANDEAFHQENDNQSESFREINQRDFADQIEENEDYMDDIIAGLYGKHG